MARYSPSLANCTAPSVACAFEGRFERDGPVPRMGEGAAGVAGRSPVSQNFRFVCDLDLS